MPFTVTCNSDLGIIETVFSGRVTVDEAEREVVESQQLAIEHDCYLFFTDLSEAELQISLFDVMEMPKTYEKTGLDRRVRVAHVPPSSSEGRRIADFYETVYVNRGWTVKSFSDRQQAVQWLTQGVK